MADPGHPFTGVAIHGSDPGSEHSPVFRRLLDQLHRDDIRYCRWKSRAHEEAGTGRSAELDILVDRSDALRLAPVLAGTGFKRLLAAPSRADPSVEHYVALHDESGQIVRLRLRYQLTLGDEHLEDYHLPWEPLVLSTRRLDRRAGVYEPDASFQVLLLLVHVMLKLDTGSRMRHWLGKPWCDPEALRELHCFRQRGNLETLGDLSQRLLGKAAGELISDMVAGEPSFAQVSAFRRYSAPVLAGYRRYRRGAAKWRRWCRRLLSVLNRSPSRSSRSGGGTLPAGGVVVAFLGCDGSGKSTLAKEITAWLSGPLGVVPVYFGSGDGPSSLVRWPLLQAENFLRKRTRWARPPTSPVPAGQSSSIRAQLRRGLWTTARAVWAVTLAYEKRGKLCRLTRARNRGFVVMCDRYPQNRVMGFSDGPLLSGWRGLSWRPLRALAEWEDIPYRWAEHIVPDLVLKLHVRSEVALGRKPDMNLDDLQKRGAAIRSLQFPAGTETVDIDANEPLDQVLREVKRCIWHKI